MSAVFADGLSLFAVRRMMEGVVPPSLATASADHVPNVGYLSLAEYVDPLHVALSYQFFNRSRENVLATKRASLTLDDPYTGAGVVLQLEYERTETEGPVFERLRAKLMGVASHVGMDTVFHLRGADIYRVLEMRRVPGRKELPATQPRVDLPTNSRLLSERMRPLGAGLLGKGSLDAADRELVILRTCQKCGAEYEWGVHAAAFARPLGLSDGEIRAETLSPWQSVLVRAVDELHEKSTLCDETFAALSAKLSEEQLLELLALVGFYHLISFVANGARVPLEPWAERF